MHYVGYAEMAAAVSNGGGLGIITALTQPTPEDLRAEIRKCRALLSDPALPFGVNVTLLPALVPTDPGPILQVIIEEKVPVVETAGRSPEALIPVLHAAGIVIVHKCVAVRHAITAERLGCDAISMDGFECGGHPGEEDIGNFVLQAIAARKLTVPYVCSGGVADGKQLAAALALGADGVNVGTAFMATTEAPVHDKIKAALVAADERDTTHVMRSVKNTERVFKNETSVKVTEIERESPGDFSKFGQYMKGANYKASFQDTGDEQSSVWSCGLSIGLIDAVKPCATFMTEMVAEAEQIIEGRLPAMLARL